MTISQYNGVCGGLVVSVLDCQSRGSVGRWDGNWED